MDRKKILVVDDNELFRDSIADMLGRRNFDVVQAPDGRSALNEVSRGRFNLVISDMKMPHMTGIELLDRIKQTDPDVPFLIITPFGAVGTAVEAMKKGAYDFIQKSDTLMRELEVTVMRALQHQSLVNENRQLKSALNGTWISIGKTAAMEEVRVMVARAADSRSTVLITGEPGTGKELIARSIHFQSPRNHGSFVKVNCAAFPDGFLQSEFFGHEQGAFIGAIMRKRGKFEAASGGTLLLDEIGEMPMAGQAKLLRALREREIHKVGGDQPFEVDVRIVVTTNRKLEEEVGKGRFREDLYHRLNVMRIHLPTLRDRREDIPALAGHFLKRYNEENGLSVEGFAEGSLDALMRHPWPGNIRELENAIERAVVFTRTGKIRPETFHFAPQVDLGKDESGGLEAGMTVEEAERQLIMKTLRHCRGNRTRAAEMLGISIRTLRNKLNEYKAIKEVELVEA